MEWDCKESLPQCQPSATMESEPLHSVHKQAVVNITLTRRQNALELFQLYAKSALADGAPPKGLEQAFAAKLQISPSMWSQLKSSRPIGDKLARQLERHCEKSPGWLDEERESQSPSPTERVFLDLALAAWRSTNSSGRKLLRVQMQDMVKAGSRSGPRIAP